MKIGLNMFFKQHHVDVHSVQKSKFFVGCGDAFALLFSTNFYTTKFALGLAKVVVMLLVTFFLFLCVRMKNEMKILISI